MCQATTQYTHNTKTKLCQITTLTIQSIITLSNVQFFVVEWPVIIDIFTILDIKNKIHNKYSDKFNDFNERYG